jgi:pyrimidine operon attenuation protein / uracil phosphoribosyltransferase
MDSIPAFSTPNCSIPDAEHLYIQLLTQIQSRFSQAIQNQSPLPAIIGIHRGGAWIAERLQEDLLQKHDSGTLDISFYRDDFATAGMRNNLKSTHIPFSIDNRNVILCDDVLNSGRSTRAALNELFEFGRPAQVLLAVLYDRGQRQLPIAAQLFGGMGEFDLDFKLILERDSSKRFCFRVPRRTPAGESALP